MGDYGVYGKTVKAKLYETDKKERYFHIYHSVTKEASVDLHFLEVNIYLSILKTNDKKYGRLTPGVPLQHFIPHISICA